ncbi:MAG: hypothetical protein CMO55_27675 [Verrucomicrobiales bacterium]|nr:hypothetical protein [Verrucomicrobiales bacterium]
MSRVFFFSILSSVLLSSAPSVHAWGVGHRIITEAALEVMPAALKQRWEAKHTNDYLGREASLAWYVCNRFNMHPDWVDGPARSEEEIEERMRSKQFVYAELRGKAMPPITYAGPDRMEWEGPRPKTYHYFTFPQEELNREFARKGSRWYFKKISEAFLKKDDLLAAEYFGAFAHAIQDRVSPFHVWDGYTREREAFEDLISEQGLQAEAGSRNGNPAGSSLFWSVGGQGMDVSISGYEPELLASSPDPASRVFADRLFKNREFAKKVYTDQEGFVQAHLNDDWKDKGSSKATDQFMSQVATENAKLTADVLYTAFVLALSASVEVVGEEGGEYEIERKNDILFAQPDGVGLLMDIYLPKGLENPPLVMFIHGGGWQGGDRRRCRLGWLAAHGYAVASVEYRMSQERVFPAQIEDCKGALRWLRANAEKYGYDAEKVVVAGTSAGGHLSQLMGTSGDVKELEGDVAGNMEESSRVQGIIAYYGASDFVKRSQNQPKKTDDPSGSAYRLIGGPVKENLEKARFASPATYVSKDDPPLLMLHGAKDKTVFLDQSENLEKLYHDAGLDVYLHVEENAGHGWNLNVEEKRLVLEFLDRVLK